MISMISGKQGLGSQETRRKNGLMNSRHELIIQKGESETRTLQWTQLGVDRHRFQVSEIHEASGFGLERLGLL